MPVLVIARHGNTFEKNDILRRVGARTDIPLTEKGRVQAVSLGRYLKDHDLVPDAVYSSVLKRTREMAEIAVCEVGSSVSVQSLDIFNEIDYGPDENKTEEELIARIGESAIKDWDDAAIVPDGWAVDPAQIINNWQIFADRVVASDNDVVLVVTSNGIARFAPYLTGDFDGFCINHQIKIATGALCVLEFDGERWVVKGWNIKP